MFHLDLIESIFDNTIIELSWNQPMSLISTNLIDDDHYQVKCQTSIQHNAPLVDGGWLNRLDVSLFVAYHWSNSYYDQIVCPLNILSLIITMALNGPDGRWFNP